MDSRKVALIAHPSLHQGKSKYPQVSKSDGQAIIAKCQQLEKRVFPKSEAMDLSKELRKPNQYLFVVLQTQKNSKPDVLHDKLMSYGIMAISKIDAVARISKVCTDPRYRRQGSGELVVRGMLKSIGYSSGDAASEEMRESLASICPIAQAGIASVQLHVDTERLDAIRLYVRCGLSKKTQIPSYYAENRNAFLMHL